VKPLWLVAIILLVLTVVGAPGWPWHHDYGYFPSVITGAALVVLVTLLLIRRL